MIFSVVPIPLEAAWLVGERSNLERCPTLMEHRPSRNSEQLAGSSYERRVTSLRLTTLPWSTILPNLVQNRQVASRLLSHEIPNKP